MKSIYQSIKMTREALPDQTAQQLQALIMSGELQPGDRLPTEKELCERLGVSRTVVRESMKLLDAIGLVKVRHGVGVFVIKPDPNILSVPIGLVAELGQRAVEDLQEVREILEPQIAALAAQHATKQDIEKLEEAVQKMDKTLTNSQEFVEADLLFHSTLSNATKNNLFQILVHSIVDVSQQARYISTQSPGAVERAQFHHRNILNAIKNRKKDEAYKAMYQHLKQVQEDLQAVTKSVKVTKE